MTRSVFPQQIDSFVELYDLPPSLVAKAKRYQELKIKPTLNATEQTELNTLTVELSNYIITPEVWNKFGDALVNVETFFNQEVNGYIQGKQVEWAGYVNSFKHLGVYNASTQYKMQNLVTYNGDLYLCIKDAKGVTPTTTANWQKVSTKGDKGDVGLNAFLKGVFSASTAYAIGDAVTYNGNVFFCIKATTAGILPTDATYWFLYDRFIVSSTAPTFSQKGMVWIELQE